MSARRAAGLVLLVTACGSGPAEEPVAALQAFLSAQRRGDCEAAWERFSRATQENIRSETRRRIRDTPYDQPGLTPRTLHCGASYSGWKPGTEQLVSGDAASATVSVMFSEGTRLALIPFLSTPYKEWRVPIQLVREDGRWKVERPRVETGRPGWRLVEIGDIDVAYRLGGDPRREWVEATAITRASGGAVEALLMDPRAWPRFMPFVRDVEPVDGPDGRGAWKWHLRFAGEGAPETTVTIEPYGRLRDPKLPWTKVQWRNEGHDDRATGPVQPPLFTGSWELRPRYGDTLWLTFGLVIQGDEWPAGMPERFLAAETVAGAVQALEREAARSGAAAQASKPLEVDQQ